MWLNPRRYNTTAILNIFTVENGTVMKVHTFWHWATFNLKKTFECSLTKDSNQLCTTHDSPGYNMIVPKNKLGGSIPVHCSSSSAHSNGLLSRNFYGFSWNFLTPIEVPPAAPITWLIIPSNHKDTQETHSWPQIGPGQPG